MACVPQTIIDEAACLMCLTDKELQVSILRTLCTIAGMSCDPQTLVDESACLMCLSDKELKAATLKKLCDISDGGGGGGTGGVTCGDVDPVAPPTAACTLYYNRTDSSLWYWDANDTTWYEMIAT